MAWWLVALLVEKHGVQVAGLRGPSGRQERADFRPCVGTTARLALEVG